MSAELPFGPDTVTWRVNLEPLVFVGAGRALLLQVAHPLVAAGVADHSDYERDPWSRLANTVDVMIKMAFAEPTVSARQRRRLEATHRRVIGVSADGVPYSALDPALLLWVWATLVDTALLVYERCYGRLPEPDRTRYYEEQKLLAHACGVPPERCPGTLVAFEAYLSSMVDEQLRVTAPARQVGAAVTGPVLRWPIGPPAAAALRLVTAGLLPASVREQYGLSWSPWEERLLRVLLAGLGGASRLVPRALRVRPARWLVTAPRPPVLPRVLQAPLSPGGG